MQHYSLLIKDVDTTQMLSAMSIKNSATREESSYHFSDLLDGINCVSAASYKISHQIVQDSKLCLLNWAVITGYWVFFLLFSKHIYS